MKPVSKLLAAILLTSSLSVAFAQAPVEPPAKPSPQATPRGPMMGGTRDMQAVMKKMQDEMTKIRSTSDPTERQKLLAEHMATMQETMGMMMNMDGAGRGTMSGGGMMRGDSKKSSPESRDMRGRMGMMEQRMEMMQMMMQQMMQHQDMMERRQ